MSDAPLTSSWCTAWGSFNTPRLWAMVAEEDDPDAWRQVATWGDIATAVKDHRSRLLAAKEALIAAWPPEQNLSADAFVNELDNLLTKMEGARQDADATADGLANILEALRQAKNQMQPLYDEYREKNDDWVPGWFDNAEDEIDEKARRVMIQAEQVVEQNVPSIKVPVEYKMDPTAKSGYTPPRENTAGDGTTRFSPVGSAGGGGGSSSVGSSGGGSGSGSGSSDIPVPHDPVPPLPGMDPIDPTGGSGSGSGPGPVGGGGSGVGGGSGGPDLAGVTPLPGPPPVVPPPPPPPPGVPPIIGQPLPPGPPPTILPGPLPGGVPPSTSGSGGNRPPTSTNFQSVGRSGGRGALPSGAVIGENVGRSGAGGAARAGNLPAGNVGRSTAAGARTGQKPPRPSWLPPDEPNGGRNVSSQNALSGSRRGRREEDGPEGKRFDPDNPWEVESGVAPVIKPETGTPRHDPGPNVIGGYRG